MKPRLLITESDAALAAVFQRFLSRHGYEVQTASGGLECLDKLRRFTPQVLVLGAELLWGGSDGVLALLREAVDVPPVAVVLLSTGDRSQGPVELVAPPVVQCLLEPFSLRALLTCIRSAATNRRQEVREGDRAPTFAGPAPDVEEAVPHGSNPGSSGDAFRATR